MSLDLGLLLLRHLLPVLRLTFLIGKLVRHRRVLFARGLQLGHLHGLIAPDERQLIDHRSDLLPKPVRVAEVDRRRSPGRPRVARTAIPSIFAGSSLKMPSRTVSELAVAGAHFLQRDFASRGRARASLRVGST